MAVAAYIEGLPNAKPTVKQHLAAIRMLFDWLVLGQIVPSNPAASVRGPFAQAIRELAGLVAGSRLLDAAEEEAAAEQKPKKGFGRLLGRK